MENKTSKYFKYAIGEIVLVVIGILIALQINNLNEDRKDRIKERKYLMDIKADLVQDLYAISFVMPDIERRLNHYKKVDSTTINYRNIAFIKVPDTLVDPKYFAYPITVFRSKKSTYNSLLSEGKTGLITNRILFAEIQFIYEIFYGQLKDASDYIDTKSKDIMWEHRDILLHNVTNINPKDIKEVDFVASLNYLQIEITRYVRMLKTLRANINTINKAIDDELEKN